MSCSTRFRPPRAGLPLPGALLAAALLPGCVVGPDFVVPAAPTASRYTAIAAAGGEPGVAGQGAPAPAGYWWQQLHSASLDETVRAALAGNRDLRAMRASLAQTDALTAASDAALYPSASLNAGVGRQKLGAEALGSFSLPPFSYYAVGASVSYLFDFSGGVRRSIEAQRARDEAQRHETDAAALALSGEVVLQAGVRRRAGADR